jgi:hypothetical protein
MAELLKPKTVKKDTNKNIGGGVPNKVVKI